MTDKEARARAVEEAARAIVNHNFGVSTSSAPVTDEWWARYKEHQAKDYYLALTIIGVAISAYEAAQWQPIETAPTDGTTVLVFAPGYDAGLPVFQCTAAYHPDGGWCVDELREPTHWRPLPEPPESKP